MELSLRRWKPGQLLLGWGAYWVGLFGIGLRPAIVASWRATRLPESHGTINAQFDNGVLNYTVIEEGVKTFTGGIPFSTAMLWVVGPPLLLWLVWLIVRERPAMRQPAVVGSAAADALPAGTSPATERRPRRDERVPIDRDRAR